MRHRPGAATALALLALPAAAQEPPEPPVSEGGTWSATFENDTFGGTDRNYTNGIRLDYVTPRNAPAWLARTGRRSLGWLTDAEDWYLTFGVGQNIYTPQDIALDVPPEDDRPYGAFLYGSVGVVADSGDRLDTLQLDLGIVGPSALGEDTQKTVHSILDVQRPRGWEFQLRDEPAVRLVYERKYRYLTSVDLGLFGLQADAAPSWSVAVGNVDTSASVGLTLRVGDRLEDTYGPPRILPAVAGPGFFESADGFGWYLFGGAVGRAVGYNIFLEGNLFKDAPEARERGVEPNRLVADFQVGLALQFQGVELAYTHVFRSEEFERQDGFAQFGSLNARVKF